eukprot:3425685-Prymnesium_polylepis.1
MWRGAAIISSIFESAFCWRVSRCEVISRTSLGCASQPCATVSSSSASGWKLGIAATLVRCVEFFERPLETSGSHGRPWRLRMTACIASST